jgi:NAD(P)-dependent dehydrogenase (short-subunit alcohol dehydrogenase family)
MGVLDGRVAVVTGGGRGIGRSISRLFAAEGAAVVVNDFGVHTDGTGSDAGPAKETVAEILAAGGRAVSDTSDVSDTATGAQLVEQALDAFGKLDILVNVAGILRDRMIFNLEPAEWDDVIRVHLRGTYSTVRPATSYWRQQRNPDGHFRIINFTSVSGLHGAAGQPNYAAAKMGIVGLTYSLANAMARYGVTANAISPGAATRMTATEGDPGASPEMSPDNVAPIALYLASTDSDWLSGRVVHSSGGRLWLYNNPEPVAKLTAEGGSWAYGDLRREVESAFRPRANGLPVSPFGSRA